MKEYLVCYLSDFFAIAEDHFGKLFSIPAGLEEAPIDFFVETPEHFRPTCACRMGWNEDGLYVYEYATETKLRMEEIGTCSHAWCDSCLEVFMAPNPAQPKLYFNYECTPSPYVYLSKGTGRYDRREYPVLPSGMEPRSLILPGIGWSIRYRITPQFLREEFGVEKLEAGMVMHGNFQKCGDLTETPHFALWNEMLPNEQGHYDFHRPEFFGRIVLA